MERGNCQSAVKDALGSTAGAIGMLVYNNVAGNLDGYSLQRISTPEGTYVPAGGISQADGQALVARLQAGETIVADLSTETKISTTFNVIAETIGGDHDNVIHMSGHSDSVAAGPGINDNGSGTISLLEVAIQLTNFSVTNAVRFSWWSGEEEGLLGATYYVSQQPQSELDKIRLMLDFDMMASPNYAYQIYDGDGSAFGVSNPRGFPFPSFGCFGCFLNVSGVLRYSVTPFTKSYLEWKKLTLHCCRSQDLPVQERLSTSSSDILPKTLV